MIEQLQERITALEKELEQDTKLINALRQQSQNQEKVIISKQGGLIELQELLTKLQQEQSAKQPQQQTSEKEVKQKT